MFIQDALNTMKTIKLLVIIALTYTANAQTPDLREVHVAAAEAAVKLEAARIELAKANGVLMHANPQPAETINQSVLNGDRIVRQAQAKLDAAANKAVSNMSNAWAVWKAEAATKVEVALQKAATDTAAAIEATARSEAARLEAAASVVSAVDKAATQLLTPAK